MTKRPFALGGRTWAALLVFGLFGQIAWVIENMYFNVFLYNTISGDPAMISAFNSGEDIHRRTAAELQAAFGAYLPEAAPADFLEMEVGTAGMMRAYMACRCTADFPLERKISRFLTMSLRVFRVPEDERARIITHVATLDMYLLARRVMNALFESLSMHFEL